MKPHPFPLVLDLQEFISDERIRIGVGKFLELGKLLRKLDKMFPEDNDGLLQP